ncbi:MAG: GDSL family lipase [Clostridium sp.]|jgi:lysophospholipase L1-like esterase|nr:GDSL family lipase [Clostridium sp.]
MNNILVLIGDSLTFGYGVPKKDSWAYKLSKILPDIKVINKSINGDTTPSMLSRYYNDVVSLNPSEIFIMGGTNDLLCGRSVKSIIDNIELMIKDSKDSKIILGIPPYLNKQMAEKLFLPSDLYSYCIKSLPILRKELIKLCNQHFITYVDFYSLTAINSAKNIYIDGVHLNSLGNNLLLDEFIKTINSLYT